VWSIPTRPYRGPHFAAYPIDVSAQCIKAGCRPGRAVSRKPPLFGHRGTARPAGSGARLTAVSRFCCIAGAEPGAGRSRPT
jgi:hypothetical protein